MTRRYCQTLPICTTLSHSKHLETWNWTCETSSHCGHIDPRNGNTVIQLVWRENFLWLDSSGNESGRVLQKGFAAEVVKILLFQFGALYLATTQGNRQQFSWKRKMSSEGMAPGSVLLQEACTIAWSSVYAAVHSSCCKSPSRQCTLVGSSHLISWD